VPAVSSLETLPAEPGVFDKGERELRLAFLAEIDRIPGGERLRRCIQCGTCTGSCPVSYAMDLTPREVIALFRAGDIDRILRSRTIWICASCYHCTTRCPSKIKITDLLYALKRVAIDRRVFPHRFPVYVLSETFAKQVKKYGRNHEAGLLRTYFLKTGVLRMLKQAGLAMALWRKGRLAMFPHTIKGIEGLRKMIARAEEFERPQEVEYDEKLTREVGYGAIG
jgi:heterodisulfide reductase subunit C